MLDAAPAVAALLRRTMTQLDVGVLPARRAQELAALGYLQWLGGLPDGLCYRSEAMRAYAAAAPLRRGSPAVAVFCDVLVASTTGVARPVALAMPPRRRRGGRRTRKTSAP